MVHGRPVKVPAGGIGRVLRCRLPSGLTLLCVVSLTVFSVVPGTSFTGP